MYNETKTRKYVIDIYLLFNQIDWYWSHLIRNESDDNDEIVIFYIYI